MIKLMVVDDEANIRKGLREYISWDAWGIELAAEAPDAETALEVAARVRPDILLTDIRMGRMDGIQMTRRLKEMLPDLRVILLSGYSEVEYLQAALQIRAAEYLLKPAGADKIIEAVLKVKNEILEERQKWQENLKRDAFLDENILIIQMHFLDEIMKGKQKNIQEIEKKSEILGIPMMGPVYAVMLADTRKSFSEDGFKSGQELNMTWWQFMQRMEQMTGKYEEVFWCETGDARIMFLMNAKDELHLEKKCGSLAQALVEDFTIPGKEQIYVGIGHSVKSPLELCNSCSSAEQALLLAAWNPKCHILYNREKTIDEKAIQQCKKKEREVLTELTSEQKEKAYVEFCELYDYYRELKMDFRKVKEFCSRLCILTMHLPSENWADDADEAPVIDEFQDAEELRKWMIQFWKRKFSQSGSGMSHYSALTRKTIQYIQLHYQEDITLQSLSKIVFASPNYLGQVFFADVGCRLNDWLNRYRVDRAKELLVSTEKKTYEIAEIVGFSGYKYFSVCFLKYAGCSAREYRMKNKRD